MNTHQTLNKHVTSLLIIKYSNVHTDVRTLNIMLINRLEDAWIREYTVLIETSAKYRVDHHVWINREDFLTMIIVYTHFDFQRSTVVQESTVY